MSPPSEPLGSSAVAAWLRSRAGSGAQLRVDSRAVEAGDVFVALPGRRMQGADFITAAVRRGAVAVLLDADGAPAAAGAVPVLAVPGLARTLGPVAAEYYGHPTAQLRTIGITGTNGKTSSCLWLAQVLAAGGEPCAALGTLGFGIPPDLDPGLLTTPDAASVQRLAHVARDRGARALAMEVSSIGLDQGRVDGVRFAVAVFTNLTRDHLDYHADMAAYAAAKRRLFFWPGLRHAVLNLDDAYGRELAAALSDADLPGGPALTGVATAPALPPGLRLHCALRAESIQQGAQGLGFTLVCERAGSVQTAAVQAPVIGDFNVANLLGVIGAALACGLSLAQAVRAVATLQAPPGRLQRVSPAGAATAQPLAIVDYAHTPDAISKVLRAVRPLVAGNGGRLCIVLGAGGDRDRGKRPAMAAAAAAADDVVLTSDNPRSEDAEAILDDLVAGLPAGLPYRRIADRAAAIRAAVAGANPCDVVLIAGKGHEEYQEIGGRRLPFSDLAVAQAALRERSGVQA